MRKFRHTVATVLLLAGSMMATEFSVSGRVLDSQGYPVPGASVQLEQPQTSLTEHTKTDEEGRFKFQVTSSGEYVIRAAAEGFEPVAETLAVSSVVNFDVRLGKVTQNPLVCHYLIQYSIIPDLTPGIARAMQSQSQPSIPYSYGFLGCSATSRPKIQVSRQKLD
jgi:Carboxypeptidase regulatory-like domain